MSHIFISYSRKDLDIAEKIVSALAQNNLNTWIDWKSIPKGEEFINEINRGIEGADVFLFLISPDSVESDWCNAEIKHAAENNKRIIPVSIRKTKTDNIPPEIAKRNWIFSRDGKNEFDTSITEILETISADYEWVKYHTTLQVKALEWEKRNKKGGLLSGAVLREAQELITLSGQKDPQPTDLQKLFVNESQKTESRNRNWILTISGIVIASLAFLVFFANNQRLLAIDNEATAQANLEVAQTAQADAQSQAATAQAASTLAVEQSNIAIANLEKFQISRSADIAAQSLIVRNTDYSLSMLLSIEAFSVRQTIDTYGLLMNNIYAGPELPPDQIVARNGNSFFEYVALSPNGKLLASSGDYLDFDKQYDEKTIILWDTNTWQPIAFFEGHTGSVDNLVFSPDSKLLASSSYYDNNIIFWSTETHQVVGTININKNNNKMEFTSDGNYFITFKNERLISWDVKTINSIKQPTGKYLTNFDLGYIAYGGFALSPNGNILAVNEDDGIIFREFNTGLAISPRLTEGRGYVDSIAFSPDGNLFAASDNAEIKFWNTNTFQPTGHPLKTEFFDIRQIIFSPDSKTLLSYSGGDINLWDVENAQPIGPKINLERSSFYLSSDGRILISGYENGIALWNIGRIADMQDQPNIQLLFVNNGEAQGLAFSPDGETLALAGYKVDSTNNFESFIGSLDLKTRQFNNKITNNFTSSTYNIVYDQQGNIIAVNNRGDSTDNEGIVTHFEINNVKTGGLLADVYIKMESYSRSVSLSQDAKNLITGNNDGTITIWDVATGNIIGQPIQVHTDEVRSVAVSPEGDVLASSSRDGVIIITDILTGKSIGQLQNPYDGDVISLAFNHAGKTLASGDEDGIVLAWDLDTDWWLSKVCQQAGRNFSYSEWLTYFPTEEYRKTCVQWDLGPKIIITPTATP